MTNADQGERERFEKYLKSRPSNAQPAGYASLGFSKNTDGSYCIWQFEYDWQTWQAALSQAQPDGVSFELDTAVESMTAIEGLDYIFKHYATTFNRTPDVFMQKVVRETKENLFMWWGVHREQLKAALTPTAPGKYTTKEMVRVGADMLTTLTHRLAQTSSAEAKALAIFEAMLSASPPARSPSASAEALRETLERLVRECPFDNMRVENELLLDLDELQHRREWLYAFLAGVELHLRGDGNGRKS